jgi:hypothetical protein
MATSSQSYTITTNITLAAVPTTIRPRQH